MMWLVFFLILRFRQEYFWIFIMVNPPICDEMSWEEHISETVQRAERPFEPRNPSAFELVPRPAHGPRVPTAYRRQCRRPNYLVFRTSPY